MARITGRWSIKADSSGRVRMKKAAPKMDASMKRKLAAGGKSKKVRVARRVV